MYLNKKNVLVMGLGLSGIATIKVIDKLGANISINDSKDKSQLKEVLNGLKDIDFKEYLAIDDIDLSDIDLIIKSPGIPPNNKIISKSKALNIETINDIELASRITKSNNIIAITGTNGKTTTTTLTGDIFKLSTYNSFVGGNIGKPLIDNMSHAKEEDVFILEVSSFQLEHTISFKPKVAAILNISPDHLDWHGTYENYIRSKKKIFQNQDKTDFLVLNYNDKLLRSFKDEASASIIYFSRNDKLDRGVYIEEGKIIINIDGTYIEVLDIDKLLLKGQHNLENVLASICIAYIMGVPLDIIREGGLNFKGVAHRLEFVLEKNGRKFFNDSKGTNVDSSIKAIEAIEEPIILIAGGYNKNIEFDDFIKAFSGKVKALILLGATSKKIKAAALRQGFNKSFIVNDMEQAIKKALTLSEEGDSILLSPACASWGMYKNFEERGEDFKEIVRGLGED